MTRSHLGLNGSPELGVGSPGRWGEKHLLK